MNSIKLNSLFDDIDPRRTAVFIGDAVIDYRRFTSDITAMAAWLNGQGLVSSQRVGIRVIHPYWRWISHLAALGLGLTHATMNERFLQQLVGAARIDVMLGNGKGLEFLGAPRRVIDFAPTSMAPLSQQLNINPANGVAPQAADQARRLVFTTGTTGQPKLVVWNADIIQKRVSGVWETQPISADSRLMTRLAMNTTAGFRYPLAVWQKGGSVLMNPIPMPDFNLLLLAPANLKNMLEKFPQVWQGKEQRTIIVAGGRLPLAVRDEALRRAGIRIRLAYGSTEAGSICSGAANLLLRHPGAVGFVIDGVSVQIVDGADKPLAPGQEGIVRVKTPYMVQGYDTPDGIVTGKAFRDGWFYPGDRGILFEDKMLAITGRSSDLLNFSGIKMSSLELETNLAELPEVEDICAVAVPLLTGDSLGLALVCADGVDLKNLGERVRARLPVPVNFLLLRVPHILRNAMGKIDRMAMAAEFSKYQPKNT